MIREEQKIVKLTYRPVALIALLLLPVGELGLDGLLVVDQRQVDLDALGVLALALAVLVGTHELVAVIRSRQNFLLDVVVIQHYLTNILVDALGILDFFGGRCNRGRGLDLDNIGGILV